MKHRVTRETALDLAATQFARNGFQATNLKVVADRLGVTRQALYYHFENKHEVLAALFDVYMARLESAVDGASPSIDAMFSAHVRVVAANADLAMIVMRERSQIANVAGSKGRIDAYRRRFTELLPARTMLDAERVSVPSEQLVAALLTSAAAATAGQIADGTTPTHAEAIGLAIIRGGIVRRMRAPEVVAA